MERAGRRAPNQVEAAVIAFVDRVPPGCVVTYGDVAAAAGTAPRHAGQLVGRLAAEIPWWRVVHVDGTPGRCHDGAARGLLAAESVGFLAGRVDLPAHRWTPGDR